MNTIHEIRRINLLRLRSDYAGKDYQFADHLGISASYFGQLKRGVREIGAQKARELEKIFSKPRGWLDNNHNDSELEDSGIFDDEWQYLMAEVQNLSELEQKDILQTVKVLVRNRQN